MEEGSEDQKKRRVVEKPVKPLDAADARYIIKGLEEPKDKRRELEKDK